MQGRPYILCGRPCFVLFPRPRCGMLTAWRGVTGMVVYWDLAALVNGAADYLLLLSAARLAGRTVPRLRLLGAAAFGAAYAVLRLVLPCSPWLAAAAFVGMALLAFRGTGRGVAARKAHARREDRHASTAARQRQSAHRSPHWGERSGHRAERPARAAAGARGGLHNAFLHDSGRQRGAAGVLLRQRSRERQGLGTAAGRRFAGHLRRQRLSGRMAHGGTGGST